MKTDEGMRKIQVEEEAWFDEEEGEKNSRKDGNLHNS
jgi:hypothetical protein